MKGFGTINDEEVNKSMNMSYSNSSVFPCTPIRNVDQFCPPIVKFPSDGFAPDWFSFDSLDYCSEKLAAALAQPPDVIQLLPMKLICDGEAALAKNYRVIRILAHQPAMDLLRSEYSFSSDKGLDSNTIFFGLGFVEKFVLLPGFKPETEIFRVEENPVIRILATDALAERVLKAKCTGIRFEHIDNPDYSGGEPYTIRTARGVKVIT
jgi:hypothetical protein